MTTSQPAEILFLLNWILLEKASNEGGIEIRSNLNDRAIHKAAYPTVPVVEPEPVLSGGVRTELDNRPVTTDEYMFHMQLGALGQNLLQLFKCMCEELRLAVIVTGKRMRSLNDPVHVHQDMIEEPFTISGFQIFENFANVSSAQLLSYTRSCSRHF
jgi:hypothetical protein